jgi:hypothetical protein
MSSSASSSKRLKSAMHGELEREGGLGVSVAERRRRALGRMKEDLRVLEELEGVAEAA